MRDFTLTIYKKLLGELVRSNYGFMTFAEYLKTKTKGKKLVILRHDVDKRPLRSLRTAEMENGLGIKGTYYFRVVKNELPREAIERIAKLGHEIGYHYEDLNAAGGDAKSALDLFQKNLAKLREVAPVKTACMHGSPLSRFDNRDLWKNFEYRSLGIIGEPYFDIDFNEVMYLTDTGRRWDGDRVSIRDKVGGQRSEVRGERSEGIGQKTKDLGQKEKGSRGVVFDPPAPGHEEVVSSLKSVVSSKNNTSFERIKIHSTQDIISALKNDLLPEKIMLTVHPQRWTDEWLPWFGELVGQKVKNVVKYFVVQFNG